MYFSEKIRDTSVNRSVATDKTFRIRIPFFFSKRAAPLKTSVENLLDYTFINIAYEKNQSIVQTK